LPIGNRLDGGPYKGQVAIVQWKKDGVVEGATTRSTSGDRVLSWPMGDGLDSDPYKGKLAVDQWKKDNVLKVATTGGTGRYRFLSWLVGTGWMVALKGTTRVRLHGEA
jgi:hypothetical protein